LIISLKLCLLFLGPRPLGAIVEGFGLATLTLHVSPAIIGIGRWVFVDGLMATLLAFTNEWPMG
jgi:hypothetical protein